ncbi:3'-5' exonuclease [Echinicola strongylocentroti]|uniref:3'-5' exonuclease n=1 Tax=Echinicola strongylocentroti TaxID=1795355 RepID=A0A2Z4II50_9BACT|nr:3'-5' exonuclease [Echinicola strongylocentroti]AWW30370.1 3'-5' exonuclease [Echinicola strongylocentroti]
MADFLSDLKDILFLDIETASFTERLDGLSPRLQQEWAKKAKQLSKEGDLSVEELYFEKAGIYAEFGKVVCVGVGYFLYDPEQDQLQFRTKYIAQEEEHDTLLELRKLLEKKHWTLCAHNGKEFDFPYLCRRMLINRVPLPEVLQMAGKKPWEIRHIDTLELWKFGDYKHYTRLELLAAIFDIPSSKDNIDGSEVNEVFYKQKDLKSIAIYCLKDVEVTARIYLAYQGLPGDMKINVIHAEEREA